MTTANSVQDCSSFHQVSRWSRGRASGVFLVCLGALIHLAEKWTLSQGCGPAKSSNQESVKPPHPGSPPPKKQTKLLMHMNMVIHQRIVYCAFWIQYEISLSTFTECAGPVQSRTIMHAPIFPKYCIRCFFVFLLFARF